MLQKNNNQNKPTPKETNKTNNKSKLTINKQKALMDNPQFCNEL